MSCRWQKCVEECTIKMLLVTANKYFQIVKSTLLWQSFGTMVLIGVKKDQEWTINYYILFIKSATTGFTWYIKYPNRIRLLHTKSRTISLYKWMAQVLGLIPKMSTILKFFPEYFHFSNFHGIVVARSVYTELFSENESYYPQK